MHEVLPGTVYLDGAAIMRLNYVMEMTRKRNATQKHGIFRSRYSTGTRVSLKFTPWMQLKQGPGHCLPVSLLQLSPAIYLEHRWTKLGISPAAFSTHILMSEIVPLKRRASSCAVQCPSSVGQTTVSQCCSRYYTLRVLGSRRGSTSVSLFSQPRSQQTRTNLVSDR